MDGRARLNGDEIIAAKMHPYPIPLLLIKQNQILYLYKKLFMASHPDTEPVIVYYGNILQAGYVKSLLENAEIPCFIKDEYVGTMHPWVVSPGGLGSVKLVVAKKDTEAALAIVKEFEANKEDAPANE